MDWIRKEKTKGRLVIGINANPQLVTIKNAERLDGLREAYVSVILGLYDAYQPSFLFIPHDFRNKLNDVTFARIITEELPHKIRSRCFQISGPYKSAEVKGICAGPDIVLSGRMHCAIACLGQGTPVASITYQDKFEGLYNHFGLENMTLSSSEAMKSGRLLEFLAPLVENREKIKKQIERKLPEIRELAWTNLR
jgi:polysaccharide pyruvyl transferase WcaK-like protein